MSGIGDSIDPNDHILSRLSAPRDAKELPAELLCPSGHRAERYVITVICHVENAPPDQTVDVPLYICRACVVAYRYGECRLIPGEEGIA